MQVTATANNHHLPVQVNPHLVTFCTVAVFLYALTRLWIGVKISAYFEAAFLLPFYYIVFKNWRYFKKQYLTWLVIATLAIPVLQFCAHYYQDPVLAMKYQGVDKLFRLTFFLAAAFWLAHNLKFIPWFILANLVALIVLILIQPDTERFFNNALMGRRANFTAVNSQFMALYSGIGIIAAAVMLFTVKDIQKIKIRYLAFALLVIAIVFLIGLFIASQTRAAFLALAFSLVAVIGLFIKHQHISFKKTHNNKALFITALIATLSIFAIASQTGLANRLSNEITKLQTHYKKEQSILADSFGGGRGELWKLAAKTTIENPVIGLGGEARKDFYILSNINISKGLQHAHNAWLDFGIAYGLLGILLLTALIWAVIEIALRQWQAQQTVNAYALFTLASISFFIVTNLFESYLFFWQGGYLIGWIAAPCVAYAIHHKALKAMPSQ